MLTGRGNGLGEKPVLDSSGVVFDGIWSQLMAGSNESDGHVLYLGRN